MLLAPEAVKKLQIVVQDYFNDEGGYSGTTHRQRNAMAHAFLEEVGKLLDQQAESVLKRAVEQYMSGALSYEQYMEIVERVSREEGERGAELGRVSARNKAFETAQKALDAAKQREDTLALLQARKEYEAKKVEADTTFQEEVQSALSAIGAIKEEASKDLVHMALDQKERLTLDQQVIREQSKAVFEQLLTEKIAQAQAKAIQDVREQEWLRPGREAAEQAVARAKALRERVNREQRRKRVLLVGLGLLIFVLLALALLLSWPVWTSGIVAALFAGFMILDLFWRPATYEASRRMRLIELYQARAGEFAGVSEEERHARLVELIG